MTTRRITLIGFALLVVLLSGMMGCTKSKSEDKQTMPKSLVGTPPPGPAGTPPPAATATPDGK